MKKLSTLLLIIFLMLCSILPLVANSAEPPSVVILVPTTTPDQIAITAFDAAGKPLKFDAPIQRFNQLQYNFYNYEIKWNSIAKLHVKHGDHQFDIKVEKVKGYRNFYALDLKGEALTKDVPAFLKWLTIGSRIVLTLLIEGAILFLFGFRKKQTWLIFLALNLVTQSFLNISLSRAPIYYDYWIFGMLIYEIIILIAELAGFLMLIKEQSRLRRLLYVVTANMVSFFVGAKLIMLLPI